MEEYVDLRSNERVVDRGNEADDLSEQGKIELCASERTGSSLVAIDLYTL